MSTSNEQRVRAWFGLPPGHCDAIDTDVSLEPPHAGRIVLITGPSGSGKTRLIRRLRQQDDRPQRWIDLNDIALPDALVADCFGAIPLEQALKLLSRCGLGEVWTYLRRPRELSEGQRWRLRLAMGLARAAAASTRCDGVDPILLADEFAAVLDRVTACVVARSLRRTIDRSAVGMICATSHEDLIDALRPDVIVRCDFGHVSMLHTSRR